jgi:hypothetical protein
MLFVSCVCHQNINNCPAVNRDFKCRAKDAYKAAAAAAATA